MTNKAKYANLEFLIQNHQYDKAIQLCEDEVVHTSNHSFWKTQLGYCHFLNTQNFESFYEKAPTTFLELVGEYPQDLNALFWLGYIQDIVLFDQESARATLAKVLTQKPEHPYANLVFASLEPIKSQIKHLLIVINVQPNNYRALSQLKSAYFQDGQHIKAKATSQQIQHVQVCIESTYGIMNTYINDVFIKS